METLFIGTAEPRPMPPLSLFQRGYEALRQTFCRHDYLPKFEQSRMFMQCSKCQCKTSGWEITGKGPRRRFEGDKRRLILKVKTNESTRT